MLQSAYSTIDNEDSNDEKLDVNMNVCSDIFREVDAENVSNCIVGRDTVLDDSDPSSIQLQHDQYGISTHMQVALS